ncbi:MAG: GtrA family protein [Acidimicrobiales bacterium]
MGPPLKLRSLYARAVSKTMVRYSLVSVVAVAVNQVVLFFAQFHMSPRSANIWAVGISAIPSYQLNRKWAWGKSGKSHLLKEVAPFWAMALLGLVFSTWAADYAGTNAHRITTSSLGMKLVVNFAAFAAFGALWVGKFFVMNRVIFASQPAAVE